MSEKANLAQVGAKVMAGLISSPRGEILWITKEGKWEAVAQAFVSGVAFTVAVQGRGCLSC